MKPAQRDWPRSIARRRLGLVGAYVVLLVSLALTGLGWALAVRIVGEHERTRFENSVEQTRAMIASRTESYLDAVYAAQAIAGSPHGEAGLREFLAALLRGQRFPGLVGFVYGTLDPQGATISLAEPPENLRSLIGFDVSSSAEHDQALRRSLRSGEPQATEREVSAPVEAGMALWIFMPVYRPSQPETPARQPTGFIAGVFRVDRMMEDILQGAESAVFDYEVYAGGQPSLEGLLYDQDGFPDAIAATRQLRTEALVPLRLSGSTWTIYFTKRPAFDLVGSERQVPIVILTAGVLLSGMLFGFSATQTRARVAAETLTDNIRRSREEILAREAETEAERRRSSFLAEASRLLSSSSSSDPSEPLRLVTRASVPFLADWCTIDLITASRNIERVAAHHRDEALLPLLSEVGTHELPDAGGSGAMADVLGLGKSRSGTGLEAFVGESDGAARKQREALARVGFRQFLCQPIVLREQVLGSITLVRIEAENPFTDREHEVATDLAHRMAVALDNARLYQQLRVAVALRDEFLSIASHELKTPLTPLKLRLQQLKSQTRGTPLESGVDQSLRQLARETRLINELLDVTRISAGKLTVELRTVNLGELVEEVVSRLREELRRSGCSVRLELDEDATGRWDPLRLEQVLINLLTNAIRYAPNSPVTITVHREPETVTLTVRDEGMGISAEDRERIFERFERAVSSRHYGGLGLGLYIVRQIVEALGGTVRVESEVGKGSAFILELPRTGPPGAPPPRPLEEQVAAS